MPPAILVLNAGSLSIKFSLFGADESLAQRAAGAIDGVGTSPRLWVRDDSGERLAEQSWPQDAGLSHERLLPRLMAWIDAHLGGVALCAAGHRVVFGGHAHEQPVRVNNELLQRLEALVPMMPLHLPHNLAPIRQLLRERPSLPQVACFDTGFHATLPRLARLFGLPRALTDEGLVRYGFHGLSYEYIAARLPQHDERSARGRTIVAHLGNGASLCALRGGASIETSMGFSALDGLLMGTRPGALDPGVLLYLMQAKGMDAASLERLLYHECGLLGVSGITSDMRELLASGDARAQEAVALFGYRLVGEIGRLTALLGGLDALVFTGGIGEHAAGLRATACEALAWLGLALDADANARHGPRISAPGSDVSAWVIPTDEDRIVAEHTRTVLGGDHE